jgi:hypothetical protein
MLFTQADLPSKAYWCLFDGVSFDWVLSFAVCATSEADGFGHVAHEQMILPWNAPNWLHLA